MEDTAKYLIHADFVADGVIERSDVVGAVFGQTEGLLGEDLDIRDLQQSSKLGRIDVEVESQNGQSHGHLTIASSLDKVETAILGAALEAIERIGPCRARVEVARVEDVRAAKRREVVERAKELLATAFDESVMDSDEILEEVRESVRVDDITEYEGLPAGPRVASSDAIIVVEGRSDVLTLLKYGIKNAIAVEGTNVPDAVADLTENRTVTAFLDSDRGGNLIRRELRQVGDVDYIARAPAGKSVEDLSRTEVDAALRNKVPVDAFDEERTTAVTDGSAEPAPATISDVPDTENATDLDPADDPAVTADSSAVESTTNPARVASVAETESTTKEETTTENITEEDVVEAAHTLSLADHVEGVMDDNVARLLSANLDVLTEVDADKAFDAIEDADAVPATVVVDGPVTQRLVDVAAQRDVSQLIGAEKGEFVKQPASVQVYTANEF